MKTKNLPRGRFFKRALLLVVFSLFAASCGSGGESAGPRTRNAGAGPSVEECFGEQTELGAEMYLSDEDLANVKSELVEVRRLISEAEEAYRIANGGTEDYITGLAIITETGQVEGLGDGLRVGPNLNEEQLAELQQVTENIMRSDEEAIKHLGRLMELMISATDLEIQIAISEGAASQGVLVEDGVTAPEPVPSSAPEPEPVPSSAPEIADSGPLDENGDQTTVNNTPGTDDPEVGKSSHSLLLQEIEDLKAEHETKSNTKTELKSERKSVNKKIDENNNTQADAINETDSLLQKINGNGGAFSESNVEKALLTGDEDLVKALELSLVAEGYHDENGNPLYEPGNGTPPPAGNNALKETRNDLKKEIKQVNKDLAYIEIKIEILKDQAVDIQNVTTTNHSKALADVVNDAGGGDPCSAIFGDFANEELKKSLYAMQAVAMDRPDFPWDPDGSDGFDGIVPETDPDAAPETETGIDSPVVAVVLDAIPVVSNDSQAQIPTIVMLADEAVVEIEEFVDEIVVTPYAAEQIIANAGVSNGVVEVKTDGEWQVVPDEEPLVVAVSAEVDDVQIRVVPAVASEPVVTQTVDLKRTPVQQLLSPEQFAAMLPAPSDDDSSSLSWILYVLIAVALLVVAALVRQRRTA